MPSGMFSWLLQCLESRRDMVWYSDGLVTGFLDIHLLQVETSNSLQEKAKMGSQCINDQSTQGRPLKVVDCRSVENDYPEMKGQFSVYDKFVEVFSQQGPTMYDLGLGNSYLILCSNHPANIQNNEASNY